jgi:hypothetical protein
MGLLYPSELKDSSEWVLSNAQDILDSVKNAGGWKKVFPSGIPTWLHKLRNYFNVEPKCLRLVDKSVTVHWMRDIRSHGKMDGFIGKRALTGHVYFDEEVEVWYQMSAGATIYHWGDDVRFEKLEAAYTQKVYGQTGIPVFKLVCPDGTGGSKETIISNPVLEKVKVVGPRGGVEWELRRSSKIGDTNQNVLVNHRVEKKMKYQGSYNFSETAVVGLDDHKKSDVEPHKKDAVYIDPPDRFAPLKDRIFNEFVIAAAGGTVPKKRAG